MSMDGYVGLHVLPLPFGQKDALSSAYGGGGEAHFGRACCARACVHPTPSVAFAHAHFFIDLCVLPSFLAFPATSIGDHRSPTALQPPATSTRTISTTMDQQ